MAKQPTELDRKVDEATKGWISVNRVTDPAEWQAWFDWRRKTLGCGVEPKNFTVPSRFPPMSFSAARQYVETVKLIREANGWYNGSKALPENPQPWSPNLRIAAQ